MKKDLIVVWIKKSEDNDGDLRSDCGFLLLTMEEPIEDNFYNEVIDFRVFFGPFNPKLSDHEQFPYVYQVATKDTCLSHGMVSFMLHFKWTWVELVISDDDQSIQFLSDLREEMRSHGICLAFVNMIPETMQIYMTRAKIYDKQIMTSSAKVVIIYGEMHSTLEVSFRRWEYLGAQRIWITTSQWDVITNKNDFSLGFFHGTVTFAHHKGEIAKFRNFMQTMNTDKYPVNISESILGWDYFNCSVSKNSSKMDHFIFNNTLEWRALHKYDMALSEEGYNLYNAVYAVAHTYHDLILQQVESQKMAELKGLFTDCQQTAFYFHAGEREEKCIIEDIPSDTLITGTFKIQRWDIGRQDFLESAPGLGMFVTVTTYNDEVLLSKLYGAQGTFYFTSHSSGEHIICLESNSTQFVSFGGSKLRIHLDIRVGEHDLDAAIVQAKDKVNEVTFKLQHLIEQVEQILKEQDYQRDREENFRITSEDTNANVLCLFKILRKKNECMICDVPCQTVLLSKHTNSNIQTFFLGIDGLCKKYSQETSQISEFQEKHRKRLVAFYQQKISQLEESLRKSVLQIKQLQRQSQMDISFCHPTLHSLTESSSQSSRLSLAAPYEDTTRRILCRVDICIEDTEDQEEGKNLKTVEGIESMDIDLTSPARKPETAVGPSRISLISPPQDGRMGQCLLPGTPASQLDTQPCKYDKGYQFQVPPLQMPYKELSPPPASQLSSRATQGPSPSVSSSWTGPPRQPISISGLLQRQCTGSASPGRMDTEKMSPFLPSTPANLLNVASPWHVRAHR
ncbi:Vomeronasal 2, receptor 15 [Apodemus speciosus]|uniref:Vomeronasal 2, receptor 15 n=1 Tax=Apodemus speciosus TaxID=105296 RepID=A0ABQ0ESU8_APOSI